jgi:acid stress-induced BolA-like protein IbaG/YrbA
MPIDAASIRTQIEAALTGAQVTVTDTTGTGDHYAARVIFSGFEGCGLVDRHRLVYGALGASILGSSAAIHALALETLTPAEAARRRT